MGSGSNEKYQFDGFVLDITDRLLSRNGQSIPIQGKVFDILTFFAQNPARLLNKEEIIENVWHEDFVEEGNLARNVSTLRKALGDTGKEHKYILTVQGRGYRFIGDISEVEQNGHATVASDPPATVSAQYSKRWIFIVSLAAIVLTLVWLGAMRFYFPSKPIRSLSVLPLKRLDGGDKYLGMEIADAVIRQISRSRKITVRPTGTVLHYADSDTDTLTAARELDTDAVLEGSLQAAGDRLRVSINLLRTADGSSLWADSFDMPATDLLSMQDKVAQQVAAGLRLHIEPEERSKAEAKFPANSTAYEFYIKGIFSLDERGTGREAMPQMLTTIDLFKRSIQADPDFAISHAQLGWAYAWTAMFIDGSNQKWADLAWQEIGRAEGIDAQIAEIHLAKSLLYWSKFENYRNDDGLREALLALQINPNSSHGELVGIMGHLGLEQEAVNELRREKDIDPTSRSLKDLEWILPYLRVDPDGWFSARQHFPTSESLYADPWYYLRKGQLADADKALAERMQQERKQPQFLIRQALLLALKGDVPAAESQVPAILAMETYQERHHVTYEGACIYALGGHSDEAVKLLRDTASNGFPNYPLFERDPYLDRIRQSPEFIQFLAEQKSQHDQFEQEFKAGYSF